jgi:hypothetical protein
VTYTIFIPGWIVAIPLVVYILVAMLCVVRFARPDRRSAWMLIVLAGMFIYYGVVSLYEVVPDVPAPVEVRGNSANV